MSDNKARQIARTLIVNTCDNFNKITCTISLQLLRFSRNMSQFNKIKILSLIVMCVLIIASYYRQNNNSKDVSIPHGSKVDFSSVKFSESGPMFVFYNRVPKCGSSTLNNLFRSQAIRSKGKFHYKQDRHKPPVEILSKEEVKSFKSWVGRKLEEKTVIFSRHIYYMDMKEFGGKVVYINQLGDPVDR